MNLNCQYHSLRKKVVFITGGASGIGAAMVKAFTAQGANVAFIDIDEKVAEQLISSMPELYQAQLWFKAVDVTDSAALQLSIEQAIAHFGGIDVLINNVANDMRHRPEDISIKDWHRCMQVNLDPAFFAAQTAYKYMKPQQSGSIINFSSINALLGPENMTGYVTAKAGLIGMTKVLANEFGADNIRVNAILPGWVATDKQLASWLTAEEEEKWMQSMSLKKRILPSDVANLALFLASDNSALITGQSIKIDGGRA
jgi:NAD(P)-dependent dehydrogenase (short-subunit alcohol dehydrogenase family)